ESFSEAIARHARHELGLEIRDVRSVLPDFRYRAVDASGIVENEVCPVFIATTDGAPAPNPEEVMDLRWVAPEGFTALVGRAPWTRSPWAVEQVPRIRGGLTRTRSCHPRAPRPTGAGGSCP